VIQLPPEKVRAAWQIGELGYRLREVQRLIRQETIEAYAKSIKFYIECCRRVGKSTYGLLWLTEDCIKNPGCVNAFFAPVKEGLKDYITPIIAQTFSDCPDGMRPTIDAGLTLTFPNGSKIIFRGSNNQQHRTKRGNAFRRVFIDEGRDVDDLDNLLESVVIPSLFSTEGRVLISSTPADTEDHPLHAIKQQAEREGWYFHCDIYEAAKTDPIDFPAERIEQWKRETTDPIAWDREYMALWVKDPTKVIIPEWDAAYIQTIQHDEYFLYYQKYVAMDLGVRDKTAAIFGYYDFKRAKLIIEDEFALKDSEVLTDNIARRVKEAEVALGYQLTHERSDRLQIHERVFRRVADNNNPLLIQDLDAKYGLNFFPTRKDELPAMINALREWVKDGRIIVAPSCKELAGCLANAIWDKNKKELARSKTYGHFDALMALVYLVRNVDTSTNPIPKYFGQTWATHPGVPMNASDQQRNGDALARVFQLKTDRDEARKSFVKGQQTY
jgi:hypothetical protein